jgi:hypothetical protein
MRIESIADIFSAEDIAKLCGNQEIDSSVRERLALILHEKNREGVRTVTQQLLMGL